MATAINHGSDNDRNLIAQVTYDKGGRMTTLRDPRGKQTTYTHDQLNRRTGITTPLNKTWTTAYADLGGGGTRTTVTDPKSVATQRDFDRVGRLASIGYGSPANTPDVSFSYNLAGMPTAMTEDDGTSTIRETTYSYDGLRRVTAVGFDTDGDSTVDETVSYEYDAGGLRTKMTLPGGLDVTYEYDANGQLVGMTDWDAQATTFAYDLAGRHVATERPGGFRSRYRYDAACRLRSLHHAVGKRVLGHFEYDLDGRGDRTQALEVLLHPATVSDTTIPHDSDALVYSGSWSDVSGYHETTDRDARLKLLFFGRDNITLSLGEGPDHGILDIYINKTLWTSIDGYATTAGQRDIVLSLEHEGPHRLVIRNRRERNSASTGNKLRFKQLVIEDIAYDARTIEYAYDTVARLLEARVNPGENTAAADGDLLRREQYTFDLAGNRLSASLALNGGSPTVMSYTYNDGNQLTSDGTNTHTYDDNGNLTSDGVSTYAWDRANRLTAVGATSYAYDGAGRRIQKTVSATDTDYLLDIQSSLTQVLVETTSSNTSHFVHSPKGIHSRRDSSGDWHWSVQDGLGSVRGEVDVDVLVEGIRHFGAYGADYGEQGSVSTPFGYTGEQTDDNDLVYLRNRYYNPTMAMFVSQDREEGNMRNPITLNRYAYVGGNPTNRVDPAGLAFGFSGNAYSTDAVVAPKRTPTKAATVSRSVELVSLKQAAQQTVKKAAPVNQVVTTLQQTVQATEHATSALTQHVVQQHTVQRQAAKRQQSALGNVAKSQTKREATLNDLQQQRVQQAYRLGSNHRSLKTGWPDLEYAQPPCIYFGGVFAILYDCGNPPIPGMGIGSVNAGEIQLSTVNSRGLTMRHMPDPAVASVDPDLYLATIMLNQFHDSNLHANPGLWIGVETAIRLQGIIFPPIPRVGNDILPESPIEDFGVTGRLPLPASITDRMLIPFDLSRASATAVPIPLNPPCPPCPEPNPKCHVDRVPPGRPHPPCSGDHFHEMIVNQRPSDCACFETRQSYLTQANCLPQGAPPPNPPCITWI